MFKRVAVLGAVLLVGSSLAGCQGQTTPRPTVTKTAGAKIVPTLFFHGYGSSYHAEEAMTKAAVNAGVTRSVVRAMVTRSGRVKLVGKVRRNDRHPIIEVNYANNQSGDYPKNARWAKNVVVALQKQYRIKQFNVVGHSMSNMSIVYYLLANAQNKRLPQLQKQVDIAGHFNGILGMNDEPNQMKLKANGRPEEMDRDYHQLLGLQQVLPKNQIQILNIYGDKNDGTHSDGRVSNASSQSLKYLVRGRAKSYREVRIVGANAQHSKLHDNAQVNRELIKFLWNK